MVVPHATSHQKMPCWPLGQGGASPGRPLGVAAGAGADAGRALGALVAVAAVAAPWPASALGAGRRRWPGPARHGGL
jgi:hypothetical protein